SALTVRLQRPDSVIASAIARMIATVLVTPAISHGVQDGRREVAAAIDPMPVAGVARRAFTISAALCGRSAGRFSRHFITMRARAGGVSGRFCVTGTGGS